jgi:hypothetical protein
MSGPSGLLTGDSRLLVVFSFAALPVDEVAEGGGARGAGGGLALVALTTLLVASAAGVVAGLLLVDLDLGAAGFFADCADAEAYLLLFLVHLDDLELVLVVDLELDRLAVIVDRFGDVAETFDTFRDFNEGSELRGAQNLALDDVADAVLGEEGIPDIRLQLLDAEREAAVFGLDAEDDGANLLTLFENFGGVLDALGPAQVGDVDEAVDAVFDLDEGSEVGEVADATLDDGAGGVLVLELLPGIVLELLHPEGDAAVVGVDGEDDGVDLVQ